MSIESWSAEFYLVDAEYTSPEEAIAHSLKKWEGLRKINLERHGLLQMERRIEERFGDSVFSVNGRTCALCVHFEYEQGDEGEGSDERCRSCPLAAARQGVPCDREDAKVDVPFNYDPEEGPQVYAPYFAFIEHGDPEPMILWLKKAPKKAPKKALKERK